MSEGEKAQASEITGETVSSSIKADVRRRSAVTLIQMIYRLAKACLLHSDSNQVVLSLVPAAIDTIVEFCELSDAESVTLVFAGETVFINSQMLRSSREVYDVARELGGFFDVCSVSELVIEKTVRRAELAAFARLLADGQRDRGSAARLAQSSLRGIRVRKIRSPFADGPAGGTASLVGRVSRTYAAAILVMRSFYASLRVGEAILPQRVKRVAQRLVSAAEEDARLLLSLAAGKVADPDESGMSVSTAIVALGIARQLTTDRRMLSALVTAALLYDVGRLRLTSSIGSRDPSVPSFIERALNDEEKERLAASSAVVLTALGKLHAPSLTRTVIAYEALALRPGTRLGPLYAGRRSPTVLARILAAARIFTELRAVPLPAFTGTPTGSPLDEVLQRMLAGSESATERAIVKLLIGALGIFPTGTFVEINTGELGIVISTPALPSHFAQPPVRILFDSQGELVESPRDVDLATRAQGAPAQFIVRPIEVEPHHEKAIRAAMSARGRGTSTDPRVASSPFPDDEIPPTEPDNVLGGYGFAAPPGPTSGTSAASVSVEERARAAPAPSRAEAAWLGRPLSSAGPAASPASGGHVWRPSQPDRPAPTEKGRDENLISTQPPPAAAFAAGSPAVPPPPRLPRDSLRAEALSSRTPQSPQARAAPRPAEARDEQPLPPPALLLPPDTEGDATPTIIPPTAGGVDPSRPTEPQHRPSNRRLDPRTEPDFAWDDEMPTIDPPPLTSPSPTFAAMSRPPASPSGTSEPAERSEPALVFHEAWHEMDEAWNDEQPTIDPPPPSQPLLERDRLLAAYLAERTPRPHSAFPESFLGDDEPAAEPWPGASPSSGPAPSSHNHPPSIGAPRRSARAPIPREEPEEEGSSPSTKEGPDRS